jgi:hypothetical protein
MTHDRVQIARTHIGLLRKNGELNLFGSSLGAVELSIAVFTDADAIGRGKPFFEIFHAFGFVVRNVTQLTDKRTQRRRQRNGLPVQTGTKPLTNFFADRRAMDATDPHATLVRANSHEKSNSRERKLIGLSGRQ